MLRILTSFITMSSQYWALSRNEETWAFFSSEGYRGWAMSVSCIGIVFFAFVIGIQYDICAGYWDEKIKRIMRRECK